jgi:hypothetical protein
MSHMSNFLYRIGAWVLGSPEHEHEHRWSDWTWFEIQEELHGPLGITRSPAYYNRRECVDCHLTEMVKVVVT